MSFLPASLIAKIGLETLEHLEYGTLHFTTPEGKTLTYRAPKPGPEATFAIHDWDVARRAMMRGDIALGEDYAAGRWDSENIENLFALFLLNIEPLEHYAHGSWLSRLGFMAYNRLVRRNSKRGSRSNIKAHYDVGNDFYRLWLDETMTYSSALFSNTDNLKEAQLAKYGRILERVGPGAESVLEIGCGWGGFAEEAAKKMKNIVGLTLSPSQHEYATKRLNGSADIRLQDYRDTRGLFDAIVSIEMFEAVGERYWPSYFKAIAERLAQGGKAVVQTITIRDEDFAGYRKRSDFLRHYVFPGGMLPSLQSFRDEAEKAGLQCVDAFSFGQDYVRTLREWLKRFEARREEILALGYNESFIRNWRFYLGVCAATFAVGRTNVVQVEMAHA